MSKISTYANSSPVLLTDKLIGTNVTGTPDNVTKNFLVSDLLTLFKSKITLQTVLDAGNAATQNITLTGNFIASTFKSNTAEFLVLPTHADNAAAVAAGLALNNVYKTATGELRIVV